MLRWVRYGFDKMRIGTRYAELVFLHLVGSTCHELHSSASGARNVDALFFVLGWARCDVHKQGAGIHYAKLEYLHLMGYWGHVVHFGAFGACNVEAVFFMLGWARRGFHNSASGHIMPNLCFYIQWDMRVT
jgi:hypothetical protein